MRIEHNWFLKFLLLTLVISTLSCETDDYPLLLDGSDQASLGEIQSLEIYSGINRVLVKGYVEDPDVTEVKIFWDDRAESVVVPVNMSNNVDSITQEIDGLQEKLYTFEVETFDNAGNSSQTVTAGAEVFGSNYAGSIQNREVVSNVLLDSILDVTYGPTGSGSGIIGTEIVYENTSGETTELFLNPDRNSHSISDFKEGTPYRYRSVYIPSLMSLDTVYTEYAEFTPKALPQIVVVTDDDKDDEQIEWLRDQGFYVTTYYNSSFGSAPQSDIDMLNSKDVIIIGRSGSSGDFDGDEKIGWNALTAPIILNTQWAARSNRLNWFDHAENPVKVGGDVVHVEIQEPGDPVFEGVTLGDDNLLPWSNTPDDFLYINPETNSNLIAITAPGEAEREEGGAVLFARFDTGVEFYPGAGESAAGPRTYFGFGSDYEGSSYYFPLTEEAKQVYLNEINRLINQ